MQIIKAKVREKRKKSIFSLTLIYRNKSINSDINNNSNRPHYIVQVNAKFNFIRHVYS